MSVAWWWMTSATCRGAKASLRGLALLLMAGQAACGQAPLTKYGNDWNEIEKSQVARDAKRNIEIWAFNRKLGDRMYRYRGVAVVNLYYEGRCIPISNGHLHDGKLPYGGELGKDPRLADDIAFHAIKGPFRRANMSDDYSSRENYVGSTGLYCLPDDGKKRQPQYRIYLEPDASAFEARKEELSALPHDMSSDVQGGRFPRCAIYGRSENYVMRDIDVALFLGGHQALDIMDKPQIACLARASNILLGLVGALMLPDDVILRNDYIVPLQASILGRPWGGGMPEPHWRFGPGDFIFTPPIPPGMKHGEALKMIYDSPYFQGQIEKFYIIDRRRRDAGGVKK